MEFLNIFHYSDNMEIVSGVHNSAFQPGHHSVETNIEHTEISMTARVHVNVSWQSIPMDTPKSYRLWPQWVRPSKVKAIKDLPIFPQVHDMILSGHPDVEIARLIQTSGLHLDDELATVQGWVSHYRATVPKALILVKHMPKAAIEAHKRVNASLDLIAEADQLYQWQKARAQKSIDREKSIDYIIPGGDKEITAASNLLDKCLKMRKEIGLTDKQMTDGLSSSNQLERFDMNRVYSREGINEKLRDPGARMKILNAVEKVMDFVSRRVEESEAPIELEGEVIDVTQGSTDASTQRKESAGLEIISEVDLTGIQTVAGDEPG